MGFQEQIPPIPTRQQEKEMIQQLEESWLSQGYHQIYMNEDLRKTKLEFSERLRKTSLEFSTNFLLFSLATLPFSYILRRFSLRSSSGIPNFWRTEYYIKPREAFQVREVSFAKTAIPLFLGLNLGLAYFTTDWELSEDPYYNRLAKVKKMMP